MHLKTIALAAALSAAPGFLYAQFDFKLGERKVQIHSFGSQGFAYSNDNNYLTMKTSQGSFAMTDGGANISTQLTDKLRVGAQVYVRNIGDLGQWRPQLDWATADYKFTNWFGIRAGKVKTVLGLYNDTQDMDFLHTFAMLPQSVYQTDLRDATIAHLGGDIYGDISLKKLGSLSYTVYAGRRKDTRYGGYPYLLSTKGINLDDYSGPQFGGDLRWQTPLNGLMVGASGMNDDPTGTGGMIVDPAQLGMSGPSFTVPYKETTQRAFTNAFYGRYEAGSLLLEGEYRRAWRADIADATIASIPASIDVRGWYTSAAYRISKYVQLGSYYSRYVIFWRAIPIAQLPEPGAQSSPDRHIYDKVVTARIDLNKWWNVKVEGHFMDGHGMNLYPTGFYAVNNPDGLKPKTNLLIIRTGWNF